MWRIKDWFKRQKDFLIEFAGFSGIAILIILAVFGPMILAGGVFKHPAWLLLYIPVVAGVLEINENY
jgi:hypothetical protein